MVQRGVHQHRLPGLDLATVFRGQQDVFRAQVAVDDADLVGLVKRARDGVYNNSRGQRRQRSPRQAAAQRLTDQKLSG